MVSNYETMKHKMEAQFLTYDQEAMARRFKLDADETFLYLRFMGRPARIERRTGRVFCQMNGEWHEADYNEAMTIFDLMCYSQPETMPAGSFVSMESLTSIHGASTTNNRFYLVEAKELDHHDEKLRQALRQQGGTLSDRGDAAAEIEVFNGLKLLFSFWNSDEDFDASLQFMWDKNVLRYLHYETVWFANAALLNRIMAAYRTIS